MASQNSSFLNRDGKSMLFTPARDDGKGNPITDVYVKGSYYRLSTETKPTAADDGVGDGDDLLLVDTKEVFIYYKGTWYLQ
jgi:hypothetical protein